jgi:cobalt/nickel transport system permease protein
MNAIDVIAHSNAWSGRHPGEKVLLAGVLLLAALILPPWPGAVLVIAAACLAARFGARIRLRDLLRVLALPAAFLLSGAATLAVSVNLDGGGPVLQVGRESLQQAAAVSLRALAATSALTLIVLTTPLPALIHLAYRLRLPEPLIDLAFLVYRFTGLALALAGKGLQAQRNRLGDRNLRTSLRSLGVLTAALLPRTLARAERLQAGLAARVYEGSLRTLPAERSLSPPFVAGSLILATAIVAATWAWRSLSP